MQRKALTAEELEAEDAQELPQREALSLLALSPHQPLPLTVIEEPPDMGDPGEMVVEKPPRSG
jgi:hypothetical protein